MSLTDENSVGLEQFKGPLNQMVSAVFWPTAKAELSAALADFCRTSTYWRTEVLSLRTVITGREYDMDCPQGTTLAGLIQCFDSTGNEFADYRMLTPRTIVFHSGHSGSVKVMAAVAPTPNLRRVPRILFDDFCEAVCHGAARRLAAMPDKAWSNPSVVSYHEQQFNDGCNRARRSAQEGYQSEGTHRRVNRRQTFY